MPIFKHILVATDFGEPAQRAQELALAFATTFGAKLTLLHVFANPTAAYGAPFAYRPMTELEVEARKALDDAAAALRERFPALDTAFRSGVPWEEVISAVTEMGVDLVLVGTHGRRGLRHALLGSVAEKVVRMSPVPVLTVP